MAERNGAIHEMQRQEIVDRIEQGAKRRLNISAADLVRRYRAGELEDPGEVVDLIILASMLSRDDPLFVPA